MSVFWQSVLAVFAAVGFYALLHTVYELVCARMLRMHGAAEFDPVWRRLRSGKRTIDPRSAACAQTVPARTLDHVLWRSAMGKGRTSPSTCLAAGYHVFGITKEERWSVGRERIRIDPRHSGADRFLQSGKRLRCAAPCRRGRRRGDSHRRFPNIGLGEEVILTGFWVTHPSYGEQFQTAAFERRLPSSMRGIAQYLGSG